MRLPVRLTVCAGLVVAGAATAADWSQFNLDPQHSGASHQETTIHASNVATLHLAYPAVALPAIADGAPAFLQSVSTPGGVKDLIFLTTKSGMLLALDAATGGLLWSKQPATGPNYTTSSPAIDPNRQFVYSYGLDGKVHKYQVGDGTEITTGGWPELTTRKPGVEKGSSALTVATVGTTPYLYVTNGGYPGDAGDYQGHVTAINLSTGAQNVFNANCSSLTCHLYENGSGDCGFPQPDCSHVQTAIWARVGIVYDADLNRIFMATGNGDYDANAGGNDWGDSVFALNPDGTGNGSGWPLDSYTPTEFQTLQNVDADLGSTAPAILPVPPGSTVARVGAQSGKDAKIRLLNLDDLSGAGGPGHVGGELQKISVPQGGAVLTALAVWVNPSDGATWVFVANGNGISGLKLGLDGTGKPQLLTGAPNAWTNPTGGTSPVVVNGVLFYASFSGMMALNPTTGAQLWRDTNLGGIHWESPIVVNGRLYVTDESAHLLVYEPDPEPLRFNAVTPCRVLDTRQASGAFGGPALAGNGATRYFPIAGQCGVPTDARAVTANVTVVGPTGPGDLRISPAGFVTKTSVIEFSAGQTRANNAILSLTGGPEGAITVQCDIAGGTTHMVLDVSGYFR